MLGKMIQIKIHMYYPNDPEMKRELSELCKKYLIETFEKMYYSGALERIIKEIIENGDFDK